MKTSTLSLHLRWLRFLALLLITGTGYGYPIGTRIRCNTATLKVRNGAGGAELGSRTAGDTGTVTAGPSNAVLSGITYTWFQVDWDSGVDGWSWVAGFNSISNPQTAATVASLAYNAGFRGWDLVSAIAVARCESGYDQNAIGANWADSSTRYTASSYDQGLWQINSYYFGSNLSYLTSASTNATKTRQIWNDAGGNWKPWCTWNEPTVSYATRLTEVRAVASAVAGGQVLAGIAGERFTCRTDGAALRDAAAGTSIDTVAVSTPGSLLGGGQVAQLGTVETQCRRADGTYTHPNYHVWWQVRLDDGRTGWMADAVVLKDSSNTPPVTLSLSDDAQGFSTGGSNHSFTVTSNTNWTWAITGNTGNWVSISEASPQNGNQTFSYSVATNAGVNPRNATITFSAAGTASVTHAISQAGGGGGGDDHGNNTATATLAGVNSNVAGSIETVGDVDYFRINLPSPGDLRIESTGSFDILGRLYNSGGGQLAQDDDSGPDANFLLNAPGLTAGTYYFSVQHYNNTTTGNYGVQISYTPVGQITVNSLNPAPAALTAGGSFQITASVTSTGAQSVLQGASLAPAGTQNFIDDPAHDTPGALINGTVNLTRTFTVPVGTSTGSYDLYYAVWRDADGNGAINAGDQQLAARMLANGIQITLPPRYTLSVGASPPAGGSVSRSPSLADYAAGSVVTVTAVPAAGFRFDRWAGAAAGSANPVNVTMTGNLTVQALFVGIPALAISPTGDIGLPAAAGASSGTTYLSIINEGQGELTWTAASSAAWLRPGAAGGTVANGSGTLNELSYSWDANTNASARTATITITAAGVAGSPKTFTFNQAGAPNTPPTITDVASQTVNEDTATVGIPFTVGDVQTAAGALIVSGSSSNTTLVPVANIVLGGGGSARTVTVTPALNQSGISTITLNVSDGTLTASDTFVLTVTAVNDKPVISDIADFTLAGNTTSSAIPFTISDVETAAASLTVTRTSSNTTLLPLSGIILGGAGTNRTVTLTPAANQSGTSTVTVSVTDGSLTATDTFVVTVTSPLAAWRQAQFGANAGNPAIAGDLANPDGDQLVNLLEYAFGGNPNSAASAPAPVSSVISNRVRLVFTRTVANTDVTITVQGADSLQGPWTDLARSTGGNAMTLVTAGTGVTESGTGATRSVEVRDLFTLGQAGHPRRFLRVKVSH